jgi:Ca2+-binding RTX toxin-like protein
MPDTVPDTIATTVIAPINGSIAGTIETAVDSDWYRVELVAGKSYTFSTRTGPSGTDLDTTLILFGSNGLPLLSDDDGGPGNFSIISFVAQTTGTYFISVGGFSTSTGDFYLDVFENTDTVGNNNGTGATVGVGGSIAGIIDNPTDSDWYRVDLLEGETYTFSTSVGPSGNNLDTIIYLRDQNGVVLASNDNIDPNTGFSQIVYTPTSNRYLFIDVQSRNFTTGDFVLNVANTTPPPPVDAVPGDITSVVPAVINGSILGTIADPRDTDWYRVELVAGETYNFYGRVPNVPVPGGVGNNAYGLEVILRDANGTEIVLSTDYGYPGSDYFSRSSFTANADGVYFVEVRGYSRLETGDYELSILTGNIPSITTPNATYGLVDGESFSVDLDAVDVDATDTLTWSIIEGGDSGLFTIDPVTGVLSSVGPLQLGSYNVVARVTDSTGLTNEVSVPIIVSQEPYEVPDDNTTESFLTVNDPVFGGVFTFSSIDYVGDDAVDSDWHRVELFEGQTYSFNFFNAGVSGGDGGIGQDGADVIAVLRGADGSIVVPSTTSPFTFTAATAGTYFLDVRASDPSDTGSYGIRVTRGNDPIVIGSDGDDVINSITPGRQDNSAIAQLDDGRFISVWVGDDENLETYGQSLFGRYVTADGLPLGTDFVIDSTIYGGNWNITQVEVTALAGGGFAVAWADYPSQIFGGQTWQGETYLQVYGANGTAQYATPIVVSTGSVAPSGGLGITQLDNTAGSLVVTWGAGTTTADDFVNYDSVPRAALINNINNVPQITNLALDIPTFDNDGTLVFVEGSAVNTIALSNGGFLVHWASGNGNFGTENRFQIFGADGVATGPSQTVLANQADSSGELALNYLAAADGGFFVQTTRGLATYDAGGNVVRVIDVPTDNINPGLVELSNGFIVYSWQSDEEASGSGSLFVQLFDQTGRIYGDVVSFNNAGLDGQVDARVIATNDGGFAIQWTDRTNGINSSDIVLQLFTIGVGGAVNTAPVATDGSGVGNEDTEITGTLSATDADGDALTYLLVDGPANGDFTYNSVSGTFTYTPNANYNGSDSFTYRVTDGNAESNLATVSLTVTPVNDAPVAANGTASGNEDTAITGTLIATDIDSTVLTYAIVTAPTNGTIALNAATGAYVYTPNANYNGTDSFTFRASDGPLGDTDVVTDSLVSNVATVALTIAPVNDAPVAANGTASGNEDTAVTGTVSATDIDSTSLTYEVVTAPANGTIALNAATGAYVYTPNANYNGPDSFTFRASDGSLNSNVATVALTVAAVNDAPIISGPVALTPVEEDSAAITITSAQLLANASDVDGDTLSVTGLTASSGTLVNNNNGTWSFAPAANFNGAVTFNYSVSDGVVSAPVAASATLNVTSVNDAPTQVADQGNVTIDEGQSVALNFASGFTDVDNASLTYSATGLPSWLTLNAATGALTGTSGGNDTGTYAITITASDGSLSASDSFTLTVNNTNVAPTVSAPVTLAPIAEDSPAITITSAQLLANAVDADGDALSVTGLSSSTGTLVNNNDGTWSFTPAGNDDTNVTFTYSVTAGGQSVATSALLDLTPVNDAAVAANGSASGNEDTAITGTVSAADIDSAALTYEIVTAPTNGTVTLNAATGAYVYTPNANYNGTDSFTYRANDGSENSNVATVTLTIAPVNDAPTAAALTLPAILEDSTVILSSSQLLAGVTDVDGDSLTVSNVTASSGTITNIGNGNWSFTPALNATAAVVFTATISDGTVNMTRTVTQPINAVNDAPVAANGNGSGNEDTAITGSVAATDVDNASLTYEIVTAPTNGTVTLNAATGAYVYTPNANYNGADSFTFRANDGSENSNVAAVTLTVAAVNDVPTAAALTLPATLEDTSIIISNAQLLGGVADVDGDVLSVTNVTASSGTLTNIGGGNWSFTPALNSNAAVTLNVTISDGTASIIRAVTQPVTAVNDAAVAANGTASGNEDTVITGTVSANDVDSEALTYAVVTGPANGTLTLNAATGAYSYTPNANYNGSDSFTFSASDGSASSNVATVALTIAAVNDAPAVAAAIPDRTASEDAAFSYVIPAGTFADVDNATLSLTTSALPTWLSFNAATRTFSGTPTNANVGTFNVTVTASDGSLSVSDIFAITVTNTNDAPTVAVAIVDQAATAGSLFSFVVPAGTFADIDAGDSLTIAASGLPAWLTYNAATRTFSGTPAASDAGTANITVTATDAAGAVISDVFAINVTGGGSVINGTGNGNFLLGTAGNDTVNAGGGNDNVFAGNGNDTVFGGTGRDNLFGQAGNDTLYGGDDRDDMFGGDGNDILYGEQADDDMYGDDGDDQLFGGTGDDDMFGGNGNDTMYGGNDRDDMYGGAGNDVLFGEQGDDELFGEAGNDTLNGGTGDDEIFGGDGDDQLFGEDNDDELNGGNGNDLLNGGNGNDRLIGGAGNDVLFGGARGDNLFGDDGNDIINGGIGEDNLRGGAGNDIFVFTSLQDSVVGGDRDEIRDFTRGSDLIDLSAIDANTNLAGDQAFIFIGGSAFTNVAGQLRFSNNILSGDVNGDGIADFQIELQFNGGAFRPLNSSDFII